MGKVTITWNFIYNHLEIQYQWTNYAPKKCAFYVAINMLSFYFGLIVVCSLNIFFELDVMPCKERCMMLLHLIDKLLINQRPMLTLGAQ